MWSHTCFFLFSLPSVQDSSIIEHVFFLIDGYEAGPCVCDNTLGWKSVGQELRPNDLTTDLTFQHGNRALASKDMKKSQGK